MVDSPPVPSTEHFPSGKSPTYRTLILPFENHNPRTVPGPVPSRAMRAMCDKIAKHSAPLGESQSGRERVRTGPGPGQGLGRGLGLLTVREKPDNLSTNCVPDSTQYRTGQEETGDGVGSNTNRNRSGALREPDQEICRSRGGRDTWRSGAVGARRANGAGLRFVRWGCRRSAGREKGEGETERKPLEPSAFAQENLRR